MYLHSFKNSFLFAFFQPFSFVFGKEVGGGIGKRRPFSRTISVRFYYWHFDCFCPYSTRYFLMLSVLIANSITALSSNYSRVVCYLANSAVFTRSEEKTCHYENQNNIKRTVKVTPCFLSFAS